jgi:hypothetical protein
VAARRGWDVVVETGAKRSFASAVDWPGLARSGKTEAEALDAIVAYAPRYARVAEPFGFTPPTDVSELSVVDRMKGDASTDFGTPGQKPKADARKVDDRELSRLVEWLEAGWKAFDAAARKANGGTLRAGPRGGGRTLAKIVDHVREAELAYLAALGVKVDAATRDDQKRVRRAIRDGLAASARGEIAPKGPRGGIRWKPRYFVRRDMWHLLDHLWEIEDRLT